MLFQSKCPARIAASLVYAATLLAGCNSQSYNSPDGYDLTHPQKNELGKSLNEISGINYNPDDTSLLAISDSKKKVIEIQLHKSKLKDYTGDVVGPDQDLEDIVRVNGTLYLLSSKGMIYEVPDKAKDTAGVKSYQLTINAILMDAKSVDFETLYYDPSVNGLIMLCKSCGFEKGVHTRSAFKFDLTSRSFDTSRFYTIGTEEIKKMLKDDNAQFDPSAAAINPINKMVYILSSAGKLLVIADPRGKVIAAYNLNPDDHPQAEGITFAPNGDMYISNEGKFGKATIQKIPYRQGLKK